MDASDGLTKLAGRLISLESSANEYRKQVALLSERCAAYAIERDAALTRLQSKEAQHAALTKAAAALAEAFKPENEDDKDGQKLLEAVQKLL